MLLFLLLSSDAQAQFDYTTNNGTITITQYTGPGGTVVIPSAITGLPVTSIGDYAFNITSVTSVMIPGSLTSIGYRAFNSCGYLTSVTISNGLASIGAWAFYYCTSLTNITIPASVTSIGALPFDGCTSLRAITVDPQNASYSSVNGVLFDKCQTMLLQYPGGKVGGYTVLGSVSNITSGAFRACAGLASVTIPESVSSIGDGTFSECANMTSATILGDLTSIGSFAFSWCSDLTNVTIHGSATSIGFGAFQFCSSLTSVTIPSGVTSIAERAFFRCSSLISVTIPNSVSWIGSFAFVSCVSLTAITVDVQNESYSSVNGVLFDKSQTTLIQCPGGKVGSYVIPATVVSVGNNAFTACGQ